MPPRPVAPAKAAVPPVKPAAPLAHVERAKPVKHHRVAKHTSGIANRFAN